MNNHKVNQKPEQTVKQNNKTNRNRLTAEVNVDKYGVNLIRIMRIIIT